MLCTCGKKCEWVENKEVYGRNYGKSYMIWLCRPCDAYVGCHRNTKKPLGTLANRYLRQQRRTVKNVFIQHFMNGDWSNKKGKKEGYAWLANLFGKEFHFGSSTAEELEKILLELNQ